MMPLDSEFSLDAQIIASNVTFDISHRNGKFVPSLDFGIPH